MRETTTWAYIITQVHKSSTWETWHEIQVMGSCQWNSKSSVWNPNTHDRIKTSRKHILKHIRAFMLSHIHYVRKHKKLAAAKIHVVVLYGRLYNIMHGANDEWRCGLVPSWLGNCTQARHVICEVYNAPRFDGGIRSVYTCSLICNTFNFGISDKLLRHYSCKPCIIYRMKELMPMRCW